MALPSPTTNSATGTPSPEKMSSRPSDQGPGLTLDCRIRQWNDPCSQSLLSRGK